MRVFLIRHGETVDNVANLYAGSRDSELTNHGVQQGTRLGQHLAASAVQFTHIFSSHLKRAVKTAELVRVAQPELKDHEGNVLAPVVAQVRELAEQDFGSYEGVSFLARQPGSNASGKEADREVRKDDLGFVDMESKESMIRRVDVFLNDHLMPIVEAEATSPVAIAVVSHGITLSILWRRLLRRLPPKSVAVHPELLEKYSGINLERIGGWSNTGYLELDVVFQRVAAPVSRQQETVVSVTTQENTSIAPLEDATVLNASTVLASNDRIIANDASKESASTVAPDSATSLQVFAGWTVTVYAVNSRQHLVGLKRTGGGVGSARHDDKQKSIDTFFKRRKVE